MLYHGPLPPVCLLKDKDSNSAVIGAKIGSPASAIRLPEPHLCPHSTPPAEATKIIQSALSHGFHLPLIALPVLRGQSPRCGAGQGRHQLHLHNGPDSRRDYRQRHRHILYTVDAITLGRAPEPCSMSNAVIAQRSSHLAPLAVCYLLFEHASMFVVSCQALTEPLYTALFFFSLPL